MAKKYTLRNATPTQKRLLKMSFKERAEYEKKRGNKAWFGRLKNIKPRKKRKHVGEVYFANSRQIDLSDYRKRRRYVVVKDNGENVGVSKIRGVNGNNPERLYPLDKTKYPLTKECGVDNKVYTTKANAKEKLSLTDTTVFDKTPEFKLTSKDTHNVLQHVKLRTGRKHKKRSKT